MKEIKPLIVAVDDESEILSNYDIIFADRFNLKTFDHPKKFLEALQSGLLDNIYVLITDLKMPYLDGVDMIRKARQLGSDFPFILLSGHLDKKAVMDATELGVFRLLDKPPSFDYLITTIEQLIIEHDIVEAQKDILQGLKELKNEIGNQHLSPAVDSIMDRLHTRLQKITESQNHLREIRKPR